MLTSELRNKLSKLNMGDKGTRRQGDGGTRGAGDKGTRRRGDAENGVLEELIPGRVHEREIGKLYVVERAIEDLYPSGAQGVGASLESLRNMECEPGDALFLDIETCGLANCPLFLIGTMSAREGRIRVEQFFARDYSEEPALLAHLAEMMADYRVLVTFNGKSFDIPYMRDRMTFHRMRHRFEHEHLDLLILARRLWRSQFPDCRLQTLEEHICGRRRHGDTPGHLIPQLYHDFVRTGNAAPLEGVFHHNALDIITMAELLPAILGTNADDTEG